MANDPTDTSNDPLKLAELFQGGEAWLPIIKPVIERIANAETFVGPARDKRIVPLRELTFQALKPNPPERWKVVVFGQSPYPRIESATGIAMFDNAFHSWQEPRFPQVASMRNMLKLALIWRHGLPETITPKEIPPLLKKHDVVPPTEWFQAILSQGVLLVDASMTRHTDDAIPVAKHVEFWAPVAEAIVEAILSAKETAAPEHKGVVFAWWGAHAKGLRAAVEKLSAKHPSVPVRHVDHWHPASRDNRFNEGNHYKKVNDALVELGASEIDWLPTPGWKSRLPTAPETTERMGGFLKDTMELHKFYLDRLQGARDEVAAAMPALDGVMSTPRVDFAKALQSAEKLVPGVTSAISTARAYARRVVSEGRALGLDEDEVAAVHVYTLASQFYRRLNAALRDRERDTAKAFYPYLRLFFDAMTRLPASKDPLWRGVGVDLAKQYPTEAEVVWWGVSSCTPKMSVATGFLGSSGARTLFEVHPRGAVCIQKLSAFAGEEEYIIAPGTRFKVRSSTVGKDKLCTVVLDELDAPRLVA
ncbi:MAG: ADP-ribosyltransferase domain-containing protein [Polyangiales bacterium]